MRVAGLFSRLLGLFGVRVVGIDVVCEDGEDVVVIDVARRKNRRMFCSGCDQRCRAIYDRGVRSWRHLDVFRVRCRIRCEVRRVLCPLVDQLRAVYLARDKPEALALLDEWILAACVSELEPFVRTALTLDTHREQVANAIALGLTNARLEGMNSTVRLLSHRARGFRRRYSTAALTSHMASASGLPVSIV